MARFTILVDFIIAPGRISEFMPLMVENAETSIQQEPGCERFDVLCDPARPDRVVLYEIYVDRAAFDVHCRSDHFARFDAATKTMVAAKNVTVLDLVEEGA